MKKTLKEEQDSLESKHREEIDRISFQHTLEINELQIKLDSQISKLKIENIQLKEALDGNPKQFYKNQEEKVDSINNKIEETISTISSLKKMLSEVNFKSDSKSIGEIQQMHENMLQQLILLQNKNATIKLDLMDMKSPSNNSSPSTANSISQRDDIKSSNYQKMYTPKNIEKPNHFSQKNSFTKDNSNKIQSTKKLAPISKNSKIVINASKAGTSKNRK